MSGGYCRNSVMKAEYRHYHGSWKKGRIGQTYSLNKYLLSDQWRLDYVLETQPKTRCPYPHKTDILVRNNIIKPTINDKRTSTTKWLTAKRTEALKLVLGVQESSSPTPGEMAFRLRFKINIIYLDKGVYKIGGVGGLVRKTLYKGPKNCKDCETLQN